MSSDGQILRIGDPIAERVDSHALSSRTPQAESVTPRRSSCSLPISGDGLRTLIGLAVLAGLLLQAAVFLLLAFTHRWLLLVVGLGALATAPWGRRTVPRSRLRIVGGEVFEWLVTGYIVASTPLLIGELQLASFLSLTITQLSCSPFHAGRETTRKATRREHA